MNRYYMSFVKDHKFAGSCIVEANSPEDACRVSWAAGCNPGGAIQMMECPSEFTCNPKLMYKLLSRAELEQHFGPVMNVTGPDG